MSGMLNQPMCNRIVNRFQARMKKGESLNVVLRELLHEIYAKAVDQLIRSHLPETMALYDKYRKME